MYIPNRRDWMKKMTLNLVNRYPIAEGRTTAALPEVKLHPGDQPDMLTGLEETGWGLRTE